MTPKLNTKHYTERDGTIVKSKNRYGKVKGSVRVGKTKLKVKAGTYQEFMMIVSMMKKKLE